MSVTAFSNVEKPADAKPVHSVLCCLCILSLAACGGSTAPGQSTASQLLTLDTSDKAIATLLYDDDRTPQGFYQETLSGDAFYTTSHIRNTDLIPAASRHAVMAYDLSTDDYTDVVGWSEQAASMQVMAGQMVDSTETSLYHQVSRVNTASPQFVQRHRVYKSSVFNRDGIDENYRGRITMPGFTVSDVKSLIEYQWAFTMENNYGNVVLSSTTTDMGDEYQHIMLQAKLVMSQHGCDRVEVFKTRYQVPKSTGNIWKSSSLEREFEARLDGHQVSICS